MRSSKCVNEFAVGDGINLYGWDGTVVDINHQIRPKYDYDGKVIGSQPCTYVRVAFDNPREVGFQYEGGWYGGADNIVAYGYFKR